MTQLDPRLNAYREDLAAASLQDRIRVPRYAEGELRQVAAPSAAIRVAPRFDAPLATEALCGELLTAYEFREGWAWVQLHDDGYVGYTSVDSLSAVPEENSHRVSARLTYLYPAPDMKRPPITKLSFSCTVAPVGVLEGRFVEISRGGFIFSDHLVGARERARDFVRVAERFVGVPYLWGGKTSLGIDCSGLVQISLRAAGIPCLRDSDMQMQSAGEPLELSNLDSLQRGDLLFWKGHVAIAQSGDWMVHASGYHMEVVVEQIRRAIERTAETHGPLLAILRPPSAMQPPAQQRVATEPKTAAIEQQQPVAELAAPAKAPPQQAATTPAPAPAPAAAPALSPAATSKPQKAASPAPAPAPAPEPAAEPAQRPGWPAPAAAPAPEKAAAPAQRSGWPAPAAAPVPEQAAAPAQRSGWPAPASAPAPEQAAAPAQRPGWPAPANAQPASPPPSASAAPAASAKAGRPSEDWPSPAAPKVKDEAQIGLAAKTVAAQIHASMAAAHKGRSDAPGEPERNRSPKPWPDEKPKQSK